MTDQEKDIAAHQSLSKIKKDGIVALIIKLHAEGLANKTISQRTGVSRSCVNSKLRRLGLVPNIDSLFGDL